MPHPESTRRREFLRWTIGHNEAAHSRDAIADMKSELKMLDSFYEMDSTLEEPDRDPELLSNTISEPNPKSVEMKIDAEKFHS